MEPFPEAFAGPATDQAEGGSGGGQEELGIAADGDGERGQVPGQVGTERGGVACRQLPESSAPGRDGGSGEASAAPEFSDLAPSGTLRLTIGEHVMEGFASRINRVVGVGLLEGGQGGKRATLGVLAEVALDADMRDDGMAEDEVPEVVSVLDEAAVVTAPEAPFGAREDQPAIAVEASRQIAIGLERGGPGGYFAHRFVCSARVTPSPNRVARALFL